MSLSTLPTAAYFPGPLFPKPPAGSPLAGGFSFDRQGHDTRFHHFGQVFFWFWVPRFCKSRKDRGVSVSAEGGGVEWR